MGIKGLKRYITQQGNDIKENINLRDEIRKWRYEHDMKEPTILIDLKGWPNNLLRYDKINVTLGIRYNEFNKKYLRFIDNLRAAGARLVFFFLGRKQTDDQSIENIKTKIEEFNSKYEKYTQMMDGIEKERDIRSEIGIHNLLHFAKDNLERMCRDLGEFHVTHSFHNWEIAEYLCNQSVWAIITDDSDFMAIDGKFENWSLGDIKFDTMDGARYSREKLISKLDLIPLNVHSVDVLVGSDSTPVQLKMQFEELLNRLTSWYGWKSNQIPLEENELMEFCKTNHPITYVLLTYEIFKMKEMNSIDFRMFRNYSYADMVLPIVMKLCGILNKDEINTPLTRKVFIKFAHLESAVVRDEAIVYPSLEFPSAYELIASPEDNDYDEHRWSLLAWALNMDLDLISKIRLMNQPKNIKVVIISLQYLLQHQEILPEEAYIVLLTEIQINQKENDPKEIRFVIYPEKPNLTYVRMAHLYPKIYAWLNRCLVVCGLSHITDLIRFDGPIFHNLMQKFDDANGTEKDELILEAKDVWIFEN